jgi:hypothetical protein
VIVQLILDEDLNVPIALREDLITLMEHEAGLGIQCFGNRAVPISIGHDGAGGEVEQVSRRNQIMLVLQ